MRIFASRTASIAAIKRKNRQFADWWNRWAVRIERTHARARKGEETEGSETPQGAETFQFRNILRLRKILEERRQ
jgi:hypothetical protein